MERLPLTTIGRIFIGVGIAGIGVAHFLLPGLRPIIAPIPPEEVWSGTGYVAGSLLIVAGALLIVNKATRIVSLSLAGLLLVSLLFGHLPSRLKHHPEILGYWTDPIKVVALLGGALLLSSLPEFNSASPTLHRMAHYTRNGKYLFASMLAIFGIDHFIYIDNVHHMVPAWIPFPVFWTYLTGIALMGAGLSIFINVLTKPIMVLLTFMLLLWLFTLHIPGTINYPLGDASSLISCFQAVYFSGTAMLIAKEN